MMESPHDGGELLARVLPAFSIAAAVTYFFAMGFGVITFIYYPQAGEWRLSRHEGLGPPMFFYGWLVDAALAGLLTAGVAGILPRRVSIGLLRTYSWASWLVPLALIVSVLFFLRNYFGS